MFRNIGTWNSFNFNVKKVAKVAHPLREGLRGPGARVPIPFNLVPRDHEKLGSLNNQRPQRGQQRERRKRKRFNKQRNNSAHAAHCFEHFFAALLLLLHDYDVKFPQAGRRFMKATP